MSDTTNRQIQDPQTSTPPNPHPGNPFEAYDRDELAKYLGTSKRYIEELDALRRGPPRLKLAGKWRYPKPGVDSWLKARIEYQYNATQSTVD
jgi:hypothetical protein